MRKLLAALLVATLVACATTAKFEEMLSGWVGADEARLVSAWGAPDSTYPMSDGSKILTYHRSGQAFIPGYATATTTTIGNQSFTQVNGSPGMMIRRDCRVDWTIRQDGRVAAWRYEGNACKSK